jgi:hypothetical protein
MCRSLPPVDAIAGAMQAQHVRNKTQLVAVIASTIKPMTDQHRMA